MGRSDSVLAVIFSRTDRNERREFIEQISQNRITSVIVITEGSQLDIVTCNTATMAAKSQLLSCSALSDTLSTKLIHLSPSTTHLHTSISILLSEGFMT